MSDLTKNAQGKRMVKNKLIAFLQKLFNRVENVDDTNTTLGTNLTVDGALQVNDNITTDGNVTADGNVEIGGTLEVTGNTTIGGDLSVTGNLTLPSVQYLMENIVDSDGHNRFVEGTLTRNEGYLSANEIKYAKWSLCGSHLMFVFAFVPSEDKNLSSVSIAHTTISEWIANKIIPMNDETTHVSVKDAIYGYVPTTLVPSTVSIRPYFSINESHRIDILLEAGNVEQDKYYRIQFDFIIDND